MSIGICALQEVSVNLLGELLFARSLRLDRFNDHVADADIDMKSDERPAIDTGFDGIPCAAVWRSIQIGHGLTDPEREVENSRGPGSMDA